MLTFIHDENLYAWDKEKLVTNIYNQLLNYLSLPERITIEFRCLGPSTYGETILNSNHSNRKILLNADLNTKDLFYPAIHEFVHVSQMHQGKLAVSRTGVYVWEGKTYQVDPKKMTYQEYCKLPWETDAAEQQKILGQKLLENQ